MPFSEYILGMMRDNKMSLKEALINDIGVATSLLGARRARMTLHDLAAVYLAVFNVSDDEFEFYLNIIETPDLDYEVEDLT